MHRRHLLGLLESYLARYPEEQSRVERVRRFVEEAVPRLGAGGGVLDGLDDGPRGVRAHPVSLPSRCGVPRLSLERSPS